VNGGNTFWLYHCIEKGDWAKDIVAACTGPNAAVYSSNSAGSIIMGESIETACWKVSVPIALRKTYKQAVCLLVF
jgi:peptidase E